VQALSQQVQECSEDVRRAREAELAAQLREAQANSQMIREQVRVVGAALPSMAWLPSPNVTWTVSVIQLVVLLLVLLSNFVGHPAAATSLILLLPLVAIVVLPEQ
jgi:hypothetical protein